MKGRMLGNSASRLHSFLVKRHTAEWMRRGTHFLQTCWRFEAPGVQPTPLPPLPKMEPVPGSSWLLAIYAREVFARLEELMAKVTSTFGSILKMASTKKVRKLCLTHCFHLSENCRSCTHCSNTPVLRRWQRGWVEWMLALLSG